MKCKNCGHNITMAGGIYFHAENGFSNICKMCGCTHPELDDKEEERKGYNDEGGEYMEDEIDILPTESDSCEIKTLSDHKLMFKTIENPIRRKIVKIIGESGKTKDEIMKEVGISESQLNFQLDYLIKECYAEVNGEIYRLNEKGKDELLVNVITPLK
jgi:hypothetical protein